MSYQCPVCGYNEMAQPPENFYICPSCGTEFENDDFEVSHANLRERWLDLGAPWFSKAVPRPNEWNPISQLRAAGFISKPEQTTSGRVKIVQSPIKPQDIYYPPAILRIFGTVTTSIFVPSIILSNEGTGRPIS